MNKQNQINGNTNKNKSKNNQTPSSHLNAHGKLVQNESVVNIEENPFYLPPILEESLLGKSEIENEEIQNHQTFIPPRIPSTINKINQTSETPNFETIIGNKSPIPFNVETPIKKSMTPRIEAKNRSSQIQIPLNCVISPNNTNPEEPLNSLQSTESGNLEDDLDMLRTLNTKYTNNPSIGYLNINSLRGNKFLQLQSMLQIGKVDIICIDETKLSSEIPTSRLHIDGYQYPPHRRDRPQKTQNSFAGGKIVYIREGFISKRMSEYETKTSETICLELSLKSKKWFIMFGYRPESISRDLFFEEINLTLSKAMDKYQNILFIGDLNIDLNLPNNDKKNFLSDLCDIFDLTNMVKDKTCFMSAQGTSIDVMLTNKPRSFYKTIPIETGLSDHHKLIVTYLRGHCSTKQKPKNILYREIKKVDHDKFRNDISNLPLTEIKRFPDTLTGFVTLFRSVVERHAPIKMKTIRGNNKPFMNSELSNAIKQKSKLRNKHNKLRSRESYLNWQNSKKRCKKLTLKAEKEHFDKILAKGIMTNKDFWNKLKPALTEKNPTMNTNIILQEGDKLITDDMQISRILNEQYVNIVETSTGSAPTTLGEVDPKNKQSIVQYINKIITHYNEHPSILKIKEHRHDIEIPSFKIPLADLEDIQFILTNIDTKKSPGPDFLPPELVKLVKDIIDEPLKNIVNDIITTCIFSDNGKIAHVTPGYKTDKKDRQNKSHYRPISVIGVFSKIIERYIEMKTSEHIESILSIFIAAYRKKYSCNSVLIRLVENWKKQLDNKKFVGAVLMDLSKAFDCVPHDLLIAKMHAYGFEMDTLVLFFSYLKDRKQGVKVNNKIHSFMTLVSGVPQGSILGPMLFNLFINDITYFFENSDLYNFADDNTITAFANTISELINALETESEIAIRWFNDNEMIVNPDKFQAIIINRKGNENLTNQHNLKFNQYEICSKNSVVLLGIEIDDKLTFEKHTNNLVRKAAGQLNYLISKKYCLNQQSKKTLIQSFIMANFNYCPLVWLFCNKKLKTKQENIQKRALRFLHNDYESDYNHLLQISGKPTIEIRQMRVLATEIFKTINDLNPVYMKEIFTLNTNRNPERKKLIVNTQNTKKYGTDTLRSLGPKIWNNLPDDFRKTQDLSSFKQLINTWSGPHCQCNACQS